LRVGEVGGEERTVGLLEREGEGTDEDRDDRDLTTRWERERRQDEE